MTAEPDTTTTASGAADEEEEKEEFKCYIGRVPTKFTEDVVQRLIVEKLGGDNTDPDTQASIVEKVELIYPHDDDDDDGENTTNHRKTTTSNDGYRADRMSSNDDKEKDSEKEHRGFGFVLFATAEHRDSALKLETIRGGRKKTSKKQHTMYLRPYVAITYDDDGDGKGQTAEGEDGGETDTRPNSSIGRDVCYLWNLMRCPYGDECKFRHVGEGGCIKQDKDLSLDELKQLKRKRKGKCFTYKKKGTCSKGDHCTFSHDFEPDTKTGDNETKDTTKGAVPNSEKDCINWKTKGKCRKRDRCVYKHDLEVQKKVLEKIAKKKRKREEVVDNNAEDDNQKRGRKEKQPLSVRVFGLNYDTTEADVKEFMESTAGHAVKSIVFPTFHDSNRGKGYCGVYFASPKAAMAAVEKCDNAELQGRWLRVQTGKSMTIEEWEGLHHK